MIITEEGVDLDQVPSDQVILTPKSFKCERAKHKARGLEYFRRTMKLQDNDFVYHMDEESVIGEYELESALDFIQNTTHDLGQGLILYNYHQFWEGAGLTGVFLNICDSIRLGDDLGRFHVQYSHWHASHFGCHGSNLLVSGKLTNQITWDNDSLTEDFFFAIRACNLGYTCGHIRGFCREQSPDNVHDLMKQRRRWFLGIARSEETHARIYTFFWVVGILACALSFTNMFLSESLHPIWATLLFGFIYSCFMMIYISATILQCVDKGWSILRTIFCLAVVLLFQPICAILETLSIFYAIFFPVNTFEVIRKN
jgi:cellulose synthase/poly-beta-1,6-N-acetylglucosamine synthase-like glycosyltransferase